MHLFPSSFTTVQVCIPPSCEAHPSLHSGRDLKGRHKHSTAVRFHVQTVEACIKEEGRVPHRWGCPQSQWSRRCLAACQELGLSSVRKAGAGSKRTNDRCQWKRRGTSGLWTWIWDMQLPVWLPCTPSVVWVVHEGPGCFGVSRNSSCPGSAGTGTMIIITIISINGF